MIIEYLTAVIAKKGTFNKVWSVEDFLRSSSDETQACGLPSNVGSFREFLSEQEKRALFLDRINILFKPERKWTELLPYALTSENFFDQRWLDILMKFSICQDLHSSSEKAM